MTMQHKKSLVVFLLFLCAIAVLVIPATRDEIHWWVTVPFKQASSYKAYINTWPSGRHMEEARVLYDKHLWHEARLANGIPGYTGYLNEQPAGKYVDEARAAIELLHWERADSSTTLKAYQDYLDRYPDGEYYQEALLKRAELAVDDTVFEKALETGTEDALKGFIADFPGHAREAEAKSILAGMRGQDIVDLLNDNKIEIEAQGGGIKSIVLKVRRKVAYPTRMYIRPGTFFVSRNPSSQNMVATGEVEQVLADDDWVMLTVPAACANRPLNIPRAKDSFTVQRSPDQEDLEKAMPVLGRAGIQYPATQAAVWIITDNADYSELGKLRTKDRFAAPTYYDATGQGNLVAIENPGNRVIHEKDAALAMRLLDGAGIDITRKRIWIDKKKITDNLKDESLGGWIREREKSRCESMLPPIIVSASEADIDACMMLEFYQEAQDESRITTMAKEYAKVASRIFVPVIGAVLDKQKQQANNNRQAYFVQMDGTDSRRLVAVAKDGKKISIPANLRSQILAVFDREASSERKGISRGVVLVVTEEFLHTGNDIIKKTFSSLGWQIQKNLKSDKKVAMYLFNNAPLALFYDKEGDYRYDWSIKALLDPEFHNELAYAPVYAPVSARIGNITDQAPGLFVLLDDGASSQTSLGPLSAINVAEKQLVSAGELVGIRKGSPDGRE